MKSHIINYQHLLIFIFALIVNSTYAQKVAAPADITKSLSQYVLENWTKEHGLPTNHTRQITQTNDGYLWLTTPSGLVRFDGMQFVTYNTTNSSIISEDLGPIAAHPNGDLLIGSLGNGLIRYKNGVFSSYITKNKLGNDILYLEIGKNDSIWVVSRSGLYQLKDDQLEKVILPSPYADDKVLAMAKDIDKSVWILLESGILFNCHDSRIIYTGIDTSNTKSAVWVSWNFTFDSEGNPWIEKPEALAYGNLVCIKNNTAKVINKKMGLSNDEIRDLYRGKDGAIWVGTADGINRIHNGKVDFVRKKDGILDGRIRGIFEDREGNIWFGSYAGGLNRLKNSLITSYTASQGLLDNEIHCVFQKSDSSIWIGTEKGLNKWENGKISSVPFFKGYTIRSIGEDNNGNMWIGSLKHGLFIYANGKIIKNIQYSDDGLGSNVVKTIYNDPMEEDKMWVGTSEDLNLFTGYEIDFSYDFGFVSSVLRTTDSAVWCGTTNGLYRLKNKKIQHFTSEDELSSNRIRDLYQDDLGNLWIGSVGGGLMLYNNNRFTSYSRENGLETNDVWGIAKDSSDFLWLSCDEGIRKVAIQNLLAYNKDNKKPLTVKVYGNGDGMANIECNSLGYPSKLVDKNGQIWFPSMGGAVRVNPYQKRFDQLPIIKIEKLTTNDQTFINTSNPIYLSPEKRNIKIDYTSIFYGDPKLISFKYKLQGYDTKWQSSEGRTSAFYTNLPPGKFTFQVKITENENEWKEIEDSMTLQIEPYFYETKPFYLLSSAIILFILYWIFKLSTKSIRKRNTKLQTLNQRLESTNTQLEQKNAEMERFNYTVSHDLKSPLITIKGFLGMIKEDLEAKDLSAIGQDLNHIDKAASSMNDLLEELLELSRVGRVVNKFSTVATKDVIDQAFKNVQGSLGNVNLEIENNLPNIHCDEKRMVEVFQNLIENAIKFMGDQENPYIKISAMESTDVVTIFVKDNGIGIKKEFQKKIFDIFERLDQDIDGTGIGLALVKRIIEVHGGKIWAESEGLEKGTTFYFTLPVKKTSNTHNKRYDQSRPVSII